ncbi:MAG: hypothetical protein ACTS5I_13160 [Rhodanobacter sp.]
MTDFNAVLAEWWNATPKQELPTFADYADRLAAAHAAELGAAEARAEAAEQDARRLDWLCGGGDDRTCYLSIGGEWCAQDGPLIFGGATLREAIATAIDAQQAEGPDARDD